MPQAALRLSMTIGGQWRSLAYLSEEQSAAAIVMLLFGLDGQILIIDQPDDYLQDPSLQSEIVRILREQKNSVKEGRQVILAAKDAALPVMADAELVLPLEIRDDRAFIVGEASIDDRSIREAIKSMMQGGEDAFRQRAEKYGKSSPSRTSSKSPSFQE
jgi:chromosome segregation protein